jgi:uncharacterized delta-60 repeat protein
MGIVIQGNTKIQATTVFGINPLLNGGRVDDSFVIGSGFNIQPTTLLIQPDGKILVGGSFTTYSGITANRIIRLNSDGSKDNSFVYGTGFNDIVAQFDIQSDGKIVVGGLFTQYSGIGASSIIRLNSDGSKDNSFVYGTGFFSNTVFALAIQSDGKIVVGGQFATYSGVSANRIIRLNSNGSIDNTFVYGTGFNGNVFYIKFQSDGKMLIGGSYTQYSGVTASRIIRLNSDGSIDNTFIYGTGFNGNVSLFDIQTDGKILVGGQFTTYSGITANRIIRLNSDGSIDNSFVYGTGFNGNVNLLKLQSDGKIFVGGSFTSYNGVSTNYIIRLNSDGSIDNTFVYGTGFNIASTDLLGDKCDIQTNGDIIICGNFTQYNGVLYNRIIRIKS